MKTKNQEKESKENTEILLKILKEKAIYAKEKHDIFWIDSEVNLRKTRGKPIGWTSFAGYRLVILNGYSYPVHRIIWLLENGEWPNVIDHINGIKNDNRIENLRSVSHRENTQNKPIHQKGRLVGAYKHKENQWRSSVKIGDEVFYLGTFKTELEAHEAYKAKLKEYNIYTK